MKIFLLSDATSSHTIKWVNALAAQGSEIVLLSLVDFDKNQFTKEVIVLSLHLSSKLSSKRDRDYRKVVYLKTIFTIRKMLKEYNPDVLHAHYASSYGLLGALTGFHPFIISVWGSDIFDFPNHSIINKSIIKYNLSQADKILSTSLTLKNEIRKYTSKEIIITPFGVDVKKFSPYQVKSIFNSSDLVIGTIKNLELIYGIEYLIRAFKKLKVKFPDKNLKLLIVGSGSEENNLKNLVLELEINNQTVFTGYQSPNKIPDFHNMIDIFVAASLQESFGVAVLEASACAKPVIVSNVGGLPEVVDDGQTGIIIEKANVDSLVMALEELILNCELRKTLGKNGRAKVLSKFDWNDCVLNMTAIYNQIYN